MRYVVSLVVLITAIGFAGAGELKKGDNEVTLRLNYSDTDLGSSQGFDLGSTEDTEFVLSYGWLVTARHEFGLVAAYVKQEVDGGDIFEGSSSDGTRLGGFYVYNFATRGMVTPFVGGVVSKLGGDLGDAYDLQYAAEVGLKIYPFEHAGVSVGLSYFELRADAQGLPDADGVNLGVGLLLKY